MTLCSAYPLTEQLWLGVPVVPVMSTGATDSLDLRNAGIPIYGTSGIFGDVDDSRKNNFLLISGIENRGTSGKVNIRPVLRT
jgi:hypothetical protein